VTVTVFHGFREFRFLGRPNFHCLMINNWSMHTIYYFTEQQISEKNTSASSSYHKFKLSSHVLWNLKL